MNHFNGLRMAVAGHNDVVAFGFDRALGQGHGLCGGGGLVQHGRVGNGHGRQIANHGLEIDQSLHAALANLCLVGCVGRVPSRVFQNIAQDHARGVGAVIALADETLEDFVLLRHGFELGQCTSLR